MKIIYALVVFILISGGAYYSTQHKTKNTCYDWTMVGPSFDGVPNKKCTCEGETTSGCEPGYICEGGTVYCLGKITGYKYSMFGNEFNNFQEWSNYCKGLKNKNSSSADVCFETLNETRFIEENK